MNHLESAVETDVVRFAAREHGVVSCKMNVAGHRGWPDRLFLATPRQRRDRRDLWIEFKRPGGVLSVAQVRKLRYLRATGHLAFVVDEAAVGREIIGNWQQERYYGIILPPEDVA